MWLLAPPAPWHPRHPGMEHGAKVDSKTRISKHLLDKAGGYWKNENVQVLLKHGAKMRKEENLQKVAIEVKTAIQDFGSSL